MFNSLSDQKPTKRTSWLVLGGSIALGLLVRKLTTTKQPLRPTYDDIEAPRGASTEHRWHERDTSTLPIDPPQETAWDRIKQSALAALASAFAELANKAAPMVMNRLTGQRPEHSLATERPNSHDPVLTPDDEPHLTPPSDKELKS